MPTYREVKGLGVSSLGEGKTIGVVEDLLVDPTGLVVRWLRISSGKLLGGGHWLPADAVREIDGQALTIDSEADERDDEGAAATVGLVSSARELIGRRVTDESGADVGRLRDYRFVLENFTITSLQVVREEGEVVVETLNLDTRSHAIRLSGGVLVAVRQTAP